MATHSSVLAWRIPWTEKPGRLQSIGLHRVGHNWSDLARTTQILKFRWKIVDISLCLSNMFWVQRSSFLKNTLLLPRVWHVEMENYKCNFSKYDFNLI